MSLALVFTTGMIPAGIFPAALVPVVPPIDTPASFLSIPLSKRRIYIPEDSVLDPLAMDFAKFRGDSDIFEIDWSRIL